MKQILWLITWLALGFIRAQAATFYVDVNSTNPVPPFADWGTASTDIQSAIDAATDGDQIQVNDGVYQTGGRVVYGTITNRVVVNKAVTIQSVHGPKATSILGYQVPGTTNGPSAIRCVYMTNNATIIGFTLAFGATANNQSRNSQDWYGGAAYCEGTNSYFSNCILATNAGYLVICYRGSFFNCTLIDNIAGIVFNGTSFIGRLAEKSDFTNCIIKNNQGGGEVDMSALINCLLTGNSPVGVALSSTLNNCTIVNNQHSYDPGDFGILTACTANNCIIYYNDLGSGFETLQCTLLNCCISNIIVWSSASTNCISDPPAFVDMANGDYRLKDWSPCIDAGTNIYAPPGLDLVGNPRIFNGAVDMGAYENQDHPTNIVHFVDLTCTNPVPPFLSWSTASTNIQKAIAIAMPGETVIVGPGMYTNGTAALVGSTTNRIALTNGVNLLGLNGPQFTLIVGDFLHRCIYIGTNSILSGFTLTNGRTETFTFDPIYTESGGGAWCETNGVVSDCIITGNNGVYSGAAIYGGSAYNCLIYANTGSAAVSDCNICNCTVVVNSSGVNQINRSCLARNSILYYNNNNTGNYSIPLDHCCASPLPSSGIGNFTNIPAFVVYIHNGLTNDYHLQAISPCINAGNNTYAAGPFDFDGGPRVLGGTVDVGAYEFQTPASLIAYAWLQNYGLPVDGSADFVDSDGDGLNNWQEWKAGTNPTNAASVLKMVSSTNGVAGTTVTWRSVSGVTYLMQRSTDLSVQPAFSNIQSNIVGKAGTTSYLDTSVTGHGNYYYRVGVQ